MTSLQTALGITEVREHPEGLERLGVNQAPKDGLLTTITLAFRTGKSAQWLEAHAGSIHIVEEASWRKWKQVKGDVLEGA